jgi:hypothetical protein
VEGGRALWEDARDAGWGGATRFADARTPVLAAIQITSCVPVFRTVFRISGTPWIPEIHRRDAGATWVSGQIVLW